MRKSDEKRERRPKKEKEVLKVGIKKKRQKKTDKE